jgi:hypothetical protein
LATAVAIDRQLGGDGVIEGTFATALEPDPGIDGEGNFASLRRESMAYLSLAEHQKNFDTIELGYDESMALREARRCLRCDVRLQIGMPVLPPEPGLEFDQEHVATVSATEGVYQLLDTDKRVLRIAGAADLRQALQEQLNSTPRHAILFMKKRLCTHSVGANSYSTFSRNTVARRREMSLAMIFSDALRGKLVGIEKTRGEEALLKNGWTKQFLASGARLAEAREPYAAIGLEVHLEPAQSKDLCLLRMPAGVTIGHG